MIPAIKDKIRSTGCKNKSKIHRMTGKIVTTQRCINRERIVPFLKSSFDYVIIFQVVT